MRSVARLAPLAILLAAILPSDDARATGLHRVGRFAQPVYVTAPAGQSARVFVVDETAARGEPPLL